MKPAILPALCRTALLFFSFPLCAQLYTDEVNVTEGFNGRVGIGGAPNPNLGLTIAKGNTTVLIGGELGVGDHLFNIYGQNGRVFGLNAYNAVSGKLTTDIGVNYALDGNNSTTQYAQSGTKKSPFIRLDAESGSVFIYGENGNGGDYRVTSPQLGLTVSGSGNVAIGAGSYGTKLEVNGISTLKGIYVPGRYSGTTMTDAAIQLEIASDSYTAIRGTSGATVHMFGANWFSGQASKSANTINLDGPGGVTIGGWDDETKFTYFRKSDGFVGIGTSSPSQKLHVVGTVRATTFIADAGNPWPDFVFDDDYNLPSLEETKEFILANKHLPGIPSAVEVEEIGIDLATMNAKLLQKVEELTLYIINQNKRIDALEKKNSSNN